MMGMKMIAWRRDSQNYDNDISDAVTVTNFRKYSSLGGPRFLLIKNQEDGNKELSGMCFCCKYGPFHCLWNNDSGDDTETTELSLMGKSETKHAKWKLN